MKKCLLLRLALVWAHAVVLFDGPPAAAEPRRVIGWVERVRLMPQGLEVLAKIDSGARTSSLNAKGMVRFERDGADWVRFEVVNRSGAKARFEKRIIRDARIRRHRGVTQVRPVVLIGICLGNYYRDAQVNLIDRTGFNYQMLIGRRFAAKKFVIDPAETFTIKPNCSEAAAR